MCTLNECMQNVPVLTSSVAAKNIYIVGFYLVNGMRKPLNINRGVKLLITGTAYKSQHRHCAIAHSTSVCQNQCLLPGLPPLGEAMWQGSE